MKPLLDVADLKMHYRLGWGGIFGKPVKVLKAVDGVTFQIQRGETLGLVEGERPAGPPRRGPQQPQNNPLSRGFTAKPRTGDGVKKEMGVPGEGSAQSQPSDQNPFGEGAAGKERDRR